MTNLFAAAIGSTYSGPTVRAYFDNGTSATYPARSLQMLSTDPGTEMIVDESTGEILYARDF